MKKTVKRFLLLLPRIRLFDALYHLAFFLVAHRRIPRRDSGLFNDWLFFHKTSAGFDCVLRGFVSDKDLVKVYYRGMLGEDLAPKTLNKFYSYADFKAANLPNPCVIKPAHLSGCTYYDDSRGGLSAAQEGQIASWFETNIYRNVSRERNYRLLQPTVICEELVADSSSIRDYKIFCYKGQPRAVQVDVDRHSGHKRRLYTVDWRALPYAYNKPLAEIEERPPRLGEALEIAARIAGEFEFLRVDVYLTDDRVYLGELTSVPENAHGRFESEAVEREFSNLLFGKCTSALGDVLR